jgi:uncharacterized hydrophobic protein (TIGR00341 family)
MKEITITISAGEGEELVKRLTEIISPSQIKLIKSSSSDVIQIVAPSTRTGVILDHLYKLGIGHINERITISDINATIPPMRSRKQDRFLRRASIEELTQYVTKLADLNFTYISLTILSVVLAAIGLIKNDLVTVIASMIIAPMLGPLIGISFGALTNRKEILKEGLKAVIISIALSVFIGALIGFIYDLSSVEPSEFIIARGQASLIDLVIAIASGLTAGILFVSGGSIALVGVAAAAALIPVIVNTGIAFGMGEWTIAYGSFILFITNITCVILGCMIIFWLRNVEPQEVVEKAKAKKTQRMQIIAIAIIFAIVAFPLIQTTTQIVQQWRYKRITTNVVADMFEGQEDIVYPPEKIEVTISGPVLWNYDVDIQIRLLATNELPDNTKSEIISEIEARANHVIRNLKLEVILYQDFGSSSNYLKMTHKLSEGPFFNINSLFSNQILEIKTIEVSPSEVL